MFEKYHRMAYSGRKITFWTPLHSEWYIHGLTSRFFCASTFDLRVHFKGSRRRKKQQIYQSKILYKVIITKDRVNGVCGIACTYIQEAKKVSKFYNITCYCSQIRAFVWSKTNLPKSGRLWTCFSIRYRLIPQKQVFEFWGMSVLFNSFPSSDQRRAEQTIRPLHRHLRSIVHPSLAIRLEDKQTTGLTKQWMGKYQARHENDHKI